MTETLRGTAGSTLDDFLAEEGILDEASEHALKRVLAWQIEQAMQAQNLTKTAMAQRMGTSRAQLDRLLDPDNDSVTLHTPQRAAAAVGRKLRLELVQDRCGFRRSAEAPATARRGSTMPASLEAWSGSRNDLRS